MTGKTHALLAAACLTLAAAACSFTPRDTGSAFMFALPDAPLKRPAARKPTALRAKTLIVALPQATAELNTYRIALKKGDTRWDYYEGARWSDFLPVVVRDDLTATLAISHIFKSVATDESGLTGDSVLKTTIEAFQADYAPSHAAPVIRIRLRVKLVGRLGGTDIAGFTVATTRRAAANTLSAIQTAFAAAWRAAERHIAERLETGQPTARHQRTNK